MLMFSPLIRHHHFAPSWRQPAMQETREYTGREGNGYDRDRESISSLCGNELRLLYTCASRVSLLDFEKYFRRCPTILVRTKSCPDAIAMRFVMIRPNFAASPIKCHDAPMLLPTCVFFIVVVRLYSMAAACKELLCLDALRVVLDDHDVSTRQQWFQSTVHLSTVSLEFCIACRLARLYHVRIATFSPWLRTERHDEEEQEHEVSSRTQDTRARGTR